MGDIALTIVAGLTQVVLGVMGIYLSLRVPHKKHHRLWIIGFVGFGLVGVAFTVWMAKHSADSQTAATNEIHAAQVAATKANLAATEANQAATEAAQETNRARAEALATAAALERLIEKTGIVQEQQLKLQVERLALPFGDILLKAELLSKHPQSGQQDSQLPLRSFLQAQASRSPLSKLSIQRPVSDLATANSSAKKGWEEIAFPFILDYKEIPEDVLSFKPIDFPFVIAMFRTAPQVGCSAILSKKREDADLVLLRRNAPAPTMSVLYYPDTHALEWLLEIPYEIYKTNGSIISTEDLEGGAITIEAPGMGALDMGAFHLTLAKTVSLTLPTHGKKVAVKTKEGHASNTTFHYNNYCYLSKFFLPKRVHLSN